VRRLLPDDTGQRSTWRPHLWVIVVPIGVLVLSYALWFAFVAMFRLPDWLAALWRGH
jgi:hypothetical protein